MKKHIAKNYTRLPMPSAQYVAERKSLIKQGGVPPWQGLLTMHRDGFGFVSVPELPYDLFIPQRHTAGAMDGDGVVVDLLDAGQSKKGLAAKITSVLWRKRTHVRGRLCYRNNVWLLEPLNNRLPQMVVDFKQHELTQRITKALVRCQITNYPSSKNDELRVQFEQSLPEDQDPHTLSAHILDDLDIRQHFPTACELFAKKLAECPPDLKGPQRRDLIDLPFVTIDGETAQDFDDAVHLTRDGNNWCLRVAIADVSAYVTQASCLDKEARLRGTSVYLPSTMIPMLPHALCANLCSLVPNQERPVLVCQMLIDKKGQRLATKIYHANIISQARLTYKQVQNFFKQQNPNVLPQPSSNLSLAPMLTEMRDLAALMRQLRMKRGSLNFDFGEPQIQFNEQGWPKGIIITKPTEATQLIEQFMLEANEATAIYALKHKLPVLFRIHEPPPTDKLQKTLAELKTFGIIATEKDFRQAKKLQLLLKKAQQHPLSETVQVILLKSLAQAVYHHKNVGHFALNAPHYAHFTSPIRRYPDLILHRAISAHLLKKQAPQLLPMQGLQLSQLERGAGAAEQRINRLYQIILMETELGKSFQALVSSRNEHGFNLQLLSPPVRGFMPIALADKGLHPRQTISCTLVRASRDNLELEFSLS